MENQICTEDGLVNAVCKSGECVGTEEGCTIDGRYSCTPCETCEGSGESAQCVADINMEGESCLDGFGGMGECIVGTCTPAFRILDQIVVNFGLQQSDPQMNRADVTLGGIVRVLSPWYLINNLEMNVQSEWPVIPGSGSFRITEDCEPTGYYCVQKWEVKFTVEKICDVATKYALQFLGKNRNVPDRPAQTYWYEVTIAQKAVCGVVIRDVPLKGGIDVCKDDQCTGPTDERVFRLGSRVFLHAWFSGLAPIEYYDVLEMHLMIASTNPQYVIVSDPSKEIDQDLLDAVGGLGTVKDYYQPLTAWTTEADEGATLTWSIILANSHFAVTVAEFFTISLDVQVRYLQGRRRALSDGTIVEPESSYYYFFLEQEITRQGQPTGEYASLPYFYSPEMRRYLQTPEEEFNYQFDHQFTVVPFRCTSEIDSWGVEVGSYAATPCPNGENLFMRYCDINGWNDDLNKNLCGEIIGPDDPILEEPAAETSGGMLWLLVIVNACAFVLICSICFLICDRYRRKRAKVKIVAMPDRATKKGSSRKEGAETTGRPRVAAEVSVKTQKPVEDAQLYE